ncbi:MAG: peroxiredoxin family protein [Thermodesulfobacteriota bacterium]
MLRKLIYLTLIILLASEMSFASVPLVGDMAPDFTLTSINGEEVTLSKYRGSVVVLGLFHNCNPCMNQATKMQKILAEGKTKAIFIGVNTWGSTRKDLVDYLNRFKLKITFPYLLDPSRSVDREYRQRFMPTVIVIDKDGVIRYRGSATPKEFLEDIINKL